MSKPLHTPTPWRIKDGYEEGDYEIMSEGDQLVAEVGGFLSALTRAANAMLIVRAVNAHDELVAALEDCVKLMSGAPSIAPLTDALVLKTAREALAKVRK